MPYMSAFNPCFLTLSSLARWRSIWKFPHARRHIGATDGFPSTFGNIYVCMNLLNLTNAPSASVPSPGRYHGSMSAAGSRTLSPGWRRKSAPGNENREVTTACPSFHVFRKFPDQLPEKPEAKKSAAYYEKRPEFGNRGPSKILLHFRKGLTFFLVIAACVIFYFLLLRIEDISVGVSKVIDVLKPILYGMVIAYLLNPIVKQIDRWLIPQLKKKMSLEKAKKVSRSVGVFAALVMLLALILALCNMLIPELYKSIRDMVQTLPGQISDMVTKITSIQKDTSPAGVMVRNLLEKGSDALQNWIKQDLLTKVNEVMSNLTVGIINFVSEILNFLIGLIVSVYILFSKETFSAQSKKIVYAVFRTDHANMILHLTKKSNEIFGGFIIGKIIDSMIIGVLCFFGLTILKMPYILLISVIVGVTNVIPFFGPYIGAIPSTILILLNDPIKGLYFLIFILVLQQLDGNVIGPKILGNSTGLSAFWVVFSILFGGGLFGFVGMIMGVPTFAVVYYIITMLINHLLEKKKLPLQTSEYGEKSYVDDSGRFVRENPEENDTAVKNGENKKERK